MKSLESIIELQKKRMGIYNDDVEEIDINEQLENIKKRVAQLEKSQFHSFSILEKLHNTTLQTQKLTEELFSSQQEMATNIDRILKGWENEQ